MGNKTGLWITGKKTLYCRDCGLRGMWTEDCTRYRKVLGMQAFGVMIDDHSCWHPRGTLQVTDDKAED